MIISGTTICIDKTIPLAPSSLSVTSSGTDIILTWDAATDEPACSGIDYYVVLRNGVNLENTTELTYTDINVPYGTYSYSVYAIDKVGHNGGPAIKNDVVLSEPNNGGSSSSGDDDDDTIVTGGTAETSYICKENWKCGSWGDCINGEQTRICNDLTQCGTSIDKPATTQECSEEESLSTNFFTGAVTGIANFVKSKTGIGTVIILFTAGGIIAFFSLKKKFFKKIKNPKVIEKQDSSDNETY